MNTLRISFCLLLLAAQSAVAPEGQAQGVLPVPTPGDYSVVGYSFVYPPSGPQIMGYAVTDMGAAVLAWYDGAEVDAYLTQAGGPTVYGTATGGPVAEGTVTTSSAAAMFTLNSYHYLICTPTYDENENLAYEDPLGFATIWGQGIGQGSFEVTAPYTEESLNPNAYTNYYLLYLGSSNWTEYGTAPQINGITASGATTGGSLVGYLTLNSSGTMTIVGLYLTAGGNDHSPTVSAASGPGGVTLGSAQVTSDGTDSLEVPYSVDGSPSSLGTYGITVTTTSGTSNTYNIVVYDPTPAITSVTPSPWQAGSDSSFPVTVQGSGFGTNPQVQISGGGVTSTNPTPSQVSLTSFVIDVTVGGTSGGTATITVTSDGYTGMSNSFAQGGHQSQPATAQVTVDPAPPPPPALTITFNGQSTVNGQAVANNTTPIPVVVGQQILLAATVTGATVQSQSWKDPSGNTLVNVVGGYALAYDANNIAQSGSVITLPNANQPCQNLNQSCLTFYFVWAGTSGQTTQQVKYSWSAGNNVAGSAIVTFNIVGPTVNSQSLEATFGAAQIEPGTPTISVLSFGSRDAVPGVNFNASAGFTTTQATAGIYNAYEWVQLISHDSFTQFSNNDATHSESSPQICPTPTVGLDNVYPYVGISNGLKPFFTSANDSPAFGLQSPVAEKLRDFSATMYLMWDPALSSSQPSQSCLPANSVVANNIPQARKSGCDSIPVPLASIQWGYKACAINTNPSPSVTAWIVSCGQSNPPGTASQPANGTPLQPAASNSYAYPQWRSVYLNAVGYKDAQGNVCQ